MENVVNMVVVKDTVPTKEMKILNITAQKPHSTGSGTYLTELVQNWNAQGHEQAVIAGIYEDDRLYFSKEVKVYPVYYKSKELPFAIFGMSDEMPYESMKYSNMDEKVLEKFSQTFREKIALAMQEVNPDMIVCHHLYLLTALVREWYPDKKIYGICHGSDLRQFLKNTLKREWIREKIGQLNGVIVLHEKQKQLVQEMFSMQQDKIHIVGVGYNQSVFWKRKVEKTNTKQIVFAGKVTEKKGIFSLLHAVEKLPYKENELTIKIAGGIGTEKEFRKIRWLAEKCRYPITFLGGLNQEELAKLFCKSHVFVLPSFYEGLPLVVLEAMACGCKIVCSDLLGVKQWISENVQGGEVAFITLPSMQNTDEPVGEELPQFESRLAEGIYKKLEQSSEEKPDLSKVSWEGISLRILELFAE
ncbi:glycosyltransferase family 4 protein [Faecalimonas sp.]